MVINEEKVFDEAIARFQKMQSRPAESKGKSEDVTFRKILSIIAQQKKATDYFQKVQQNILMRAELRDKKGMYGMPNIAKILTGGAGSVIPHLGKLQKMAQQPFKDQIEYHKGGVEFRERRKAGEFKGDPEKEAAEQEKLEVLRKKAGGTRPFGGNTRIEKIMNSLTGKVGKFMEGSKGQGLMAGIMGGASIITMIIKKAMEASPMLQQMLKIMNVAMTLFLRPIGDFIGGMLKPIMLFFLREVAVPMLRKGKDMIKIGEAFGKGALGFLLKPIETIREALNPLSSSFDGLKEWMTEQKLRGLAAEMDGREMLTVLSIIKNKDKVDKTVGADPFTGAPGYTTTYGADYASLQANFPKFLAQFEEIMTQGQAHGGNMSYAYVSKYFDNMQGTGDVKSGMGAVAGTFAGISEKGNVLAGTFERINDALGTGGVQDPNIPNPNAPIGDGITQDYPRPETPEQIAAREKEEQKVTHWTDVKVYDTVAKMLAAAGVQIMGGLKAKGGSEEYIQAKKEYDVLTTKGGMGPGTQSVFEGIKIRFKKLTFEQNMIMDEIKKNQFGILVAGGDLLESAIFSSTIATDESDLRNRVFKDNLKPDSDEVLTSSGNIANNFIKSSILISEGTEQIENLIDKIPGGRYYSGGNRSQPWRTGGSYDEDTGYVGSVGGLPSWLGGVSIVDPNLSKSVLKGQHGGMINEPIWGIGKSGQRYTFGEAGSELVTPMTGGKNTLGNITANITVNIEKVLQDVDLEQIKPIVERALLEVHSRRGII